MIFMDLCTYQVHNAYMQSQYYLDTCETPSSRARRGLIASRSGRYALSVEKLFQRALRLVVWAFLISLLANSAALAANELMPKRIRLASGVVYTLFPQGNLAFDFVVARPSPMRADIVLCIPAAFTTAHNQVDGVFISNGAIGNGSAVNRDLGGAIIIENGKCRLFPSDQGVALSEEVLQGVQQSHGSLFQQFLIVHECKPASFKDKSKFQRRAICETTKGTFGIIESDRPISFATFNDDLVALGIKEALYADMGAWGEGWYRNATTDKIIKIGLDRSLTYKQSNWLLLKKPKFVEEPRRAFPIRLHLRDTPGSVSRH